MAFLDVFEDIKKALNKVKATGIKEHIAVQVNLTDKDSSGIFYIELSDGKVNVEPYDYYDRDALVTVNSKDFIDIFTAKLDFDKAVNDGIFKIEGNKVKADELKKIIKKPTPRRKTTKKTDETATGTKPEKTAAKTTKKIAQPADKS